MHYKELTRKLLFKLLGLSKPVLIAGAVLLILQATGLRRSINEVSHRSLLNTGIYDTTNESLADPEDFDYRFLIKDLQGNKVSFDQFKGKVVFLNLWATWCGPCRAEMQGIQKLYEKVNNDSVVFVMLSIDRDRDKGKIVEYIHQKEFSFPVYQPSGNLPRQLNVREIPTTFIISKDGKIMKKEIGSKNYDNAKFQKYLLELSE